MSLIQVLQDKLMENNVIELECEIEELLDAADLLLELLVHLPLVWLLLSPMIQ